MYFALAEKKTFSYLISKIDRCILVSGNENWYELERAGPQYTRGVCEYVFLTTSDNNKTKEIYN